MTGTSSADIGDLETGVRILDVVDYDYLPYHPEPSANRTETYKQPVSVKQARSAIRLLSNDLLGARIKPDTARFRYKLDWLPADPNYEVLRNPRLDELLRVLAFADIKEELTAKVNPRDVLTRNYSWYDRLYTRHVAVKGLGCIGYLQCNELEDLRADWAEYLVEETIAVLGKEPLVKELCVMQLFVETVVDYVRYSQPGDAEEFEMREFRFMYNRRGEHSESDRFYIERDNGRIDIWYTDDEADSAETTEKGVNKNYQDTLKLLYMRHWNKRCKP